VNELLHNEVDSPSIIWNDGSTFYYKYGQLHRDNLKPAVIYSFGEKLYYIDNKKIDKSIIDQLILEKNINLF